MIRLVQFKADLCDEKLWDLVGFFPFPCHVGMSAVMGLEAQIHDLSCCLVDPQIGPFYTLKSQTAKQPKRANGSMWGKLCSLQLELFCSQLSFSCYSTFWCSLVKFLVKKKEAPIVGKGASRKQM